MQKHAIDDRKQYEIRYEQVREDRTLALFCDAKPGRLPVQEKISFLHYHDFCEVGICLDGEGLFYADGEFWTLRPGDVIFVPPDRSHYSRSLHRDKPCFCRFLYLRTEALQEVMGESMDSMWKRRIPTVVHPHEHPRAAAQLTEVCRFGFEERAESVALVAHQLAIFLLECQSHFEGEWGIASDQIGDGSHSVAERLARHLSIYYRQSEEIGALAAKFHMSESQLRRRFVRVFGIPPVAYRNRLRCNVAKELLCRTELGIAQISEQVGFDDPTDFYRRFRAETGQSPSDFRKKAKQI